MDSHFEISRVEGSMLHLELMIILVKVTAGKKDYLPYFSGYKTGFSSF